MKWRLVLRISFVYIELEFSKVSKRVRLVTLSSKVKHSHFLLIDGKNISSMFYKELDHPRIAMERCEMQCSKTLMVF